MSTINNLKNMTFEELENTNGGKLTDWLPFAQPAWDFACGLANGIKDGVNDGLK